jgi:hypothetical protein
MLLDRDINATHVTFGTEYSLVFLKIMRTPSRVHRQRLNDLGIFSPRLKIAVKARGEC